MNPPITFITKYDFGILCSLLILYSLEFIITTVTKSHERPGPNIAGSKKYVV